MKPHPTCRLLLCAGLLAVASAVPAFSQTDSGYSGPASASTASGSIPVIVNGARFNSITGPANSAWYEMDIQLQTAPATRGAQLTGRIKVEVDLGIEARLAAPNAAGETKQVDFYHASAQLVGLPLGGGTYDVRFYLPPEIVARDGIQGPAKYYAVSLSVDGKALPMRDKNVSASTITSPQILESFRAKASSDGAANNGIFVPQYLTPFVADFGRPCPSYVRVESPH